MSTNEKGTLIYEEVSSDYIKRRYFHLIFLLFIIFGFLLFNIILIIEGVFISSSENLGMFLLGDLGFILIIIFVYYTDRRKIFSNRLRIFERGITLPAIYKKEGGFLGFDKIIYVDIKKIEIREKDYCGGIDIYIGEDKEINREKIKGLRGTELQELLKNYEKVTVISRDISKRSLDELLKTFVRKNYLDKELVRKLKHPISWRQG